MKKVSLTTKRNQEFEKMTMLEESLRKNRGLAFLMSRTIAALAAGEDVTSPPNEMDMCGICDLSDSISEEVGVRFTEAWENTVNSRSSTEQDAA